MAIAAALLSSVAFSSEPEAVSEGDFVGKLYDDGSGIFGSQFEVSKYGDVWNLTVTADPITDKKIIRAKRNVFNQLEGFGKVQLRTEMALEIDLSSPGAEKLCVSGHNYPNKSAVIRVGKGTPISTSKSGCTPITKELDAKLKSESALVMRGYRWPYAGGENLTVDLSGYAELTSLLRKRRGQ